MRWRHLDLDNGTVRVFQITRSRYQHGCPDPTACAAHHHTPACRKPFPRHQRCPTPCPPGCSLHAQHCPQRTGGEWNFKQPKGGKARTIALPRPLIDLLLQTRQRQAHEKAAAGDAWTEWDLCFPNPTGDPQEPREDWAGWRLLCAQAGVRPARIHDARHTAATILLEQGVDIRVVQPILGHSTLAVTQKYTHVTNQLAREAAEKMAQALWPHPAAAEGIGATEGARSTQAQR